MLQLSQNFFNFLAGQYTLLHVCRGGWGGVGWGGGRVGGGGGCRGYGRWEGDVF